MTHYVGLSYGGSTINLTTGDNLLQQYSLKPARQNANGSYEPVSERVNVVVSGTDAEDVQANVHAIERWLSTTAERKAVGEGERLYLEVRPSGYTDTYRTELLEATFVPAPNTLELWANFQLQGAIELRRMPYFEGPRTQLPLSNRYSAGTTAWLQIDNRNDSTRDAFVNIGSGSIKGTLPAPAEIHLRNDLGSGASWRNFYIGVDARSGPTSLEPVLEGEAQSGGGGSNSADTSASGGSVWTVGTTAPNVHKHPKWTIPSTWADAFQGRFARVLVRVGTSSYDWVYQAKIKEQYGLIDLFVGRPRSSGDDKIVDLGTVPVPPIAYTTDLAEQKLEIELYHTGAGSTYNSIDFIALLPTDSGRTIVQTGMQIPDGDWVIFDEIEKVWVSNESNLKHPIFSPRGPGVLLFPGVANRVWVFHDGYASSGDPSAPKSIKMYYRPRRLTL